MGGFGGVWGGFFKVLEGFWVFLGRFLGICLRCFFGSFVEFLEGFGEDGFGEFGGVWEGCGQILKMFDESWPCWQVL